MRDPLLVMYRNFYFIISVVCFILIVVSMLLQYCTMMRSCNYATATATAAAATAAAATAAAASATASTTTSTTTTFSTTTISSSTTSTSNCCYC